ncbi:MAG: transposase [Chromatiaceae bacterium]|nr:transposase [Chromatiaceae bacterium]
MRGLLEQEPDPDQQLKYLDFIDNDAHLSEEERMIYQQEYAPEAAVITGFAERFQLQGEACGKAMGEPRLLRQLLAQHIGAPSANIEQRLASADGDTLATWVDRALDATTCKGIFRD